MTESEHFSSGSGPERKENGRPLEQERSGLARPDESGPFPAPGKEAGEGFSTPEAGVPGEAPAFETADPAEAFAPEFETFAPETDGFFSAAEAFASETGLFAPDPDAFAPGSKPFSPGAFAPDDDDAFASASENNGDLFSSDNGENDEISASASEDDEMFASESADASASAFETGPRAGIFAVVEGGSDPADEAPAKSRRARFLGVRLRKAGQVFFFPDEQFSVRVGSKVIVEFEQGSVFGEVDNILHGDPPAPDGSSVQTATGRILGLATAQDIALHAENRILAGEATAFCTTCIRQRGLDMKLVDVEVLHDRSKIIFYFTAPARIDFRELVKDLVRNYRTRIELRQIGVRHETQMVGGIGNCGMVCCCHQYLRKFAPVTIKMAKEQNLFLNPAKLSGMCGRLLCCLSFEQSNYEEFNRRCPKLGKRYATSDGTFRIVRANMFSRTIVVCSDAGEERELTLDEWADIAPRRAEGPAPDAPQGPAQQSRRVSGDGGRKPRSRSRDERRHGGKTGERDAAESPFTVDAAEDGAFAAGWDRDDPLDFAGQERERRRDQQQRDDRPRHGDRPHPDSAPAAFSVPPDDEPAAP